MHKDDISVVYLFPFFDRLDSLSGFAVTQAVVLDPPQAVDSTGLGGEGLEEPTRPTEYARILSVRRIQLVEWNEGVIIFQLDRAGYDLKSGMGFLLQILSEIIRHEEITGLALIWQ